MIRIYIYSLNLTGSIINCLTSMALLVLGSHTTTVSARSSLEDYFGHDYKSLVHFAELNDLSSSY